MKIAQILLDKGYNFKGRKMWQIAIKKALTEEQNGKGSTSNKDVSK